MVPAIIVKMVKRMMKSVRNRRRTITKAQREARKARRNKLVRDNSSNFVEQFSKQCLDGGITEGKIVSSLSSKLYHENYDKIDWGGSASGSNSEVLPSRTRSEQWSRREV
jgi:hypothetical protein